MREIEVKDFEFISGGGVADPNACQSAMLGAASVGVMQEE